MHVKAYACVHVVDGTRPVLLVCRGEDDWSFLCGDGHDDSEVWCRVIHPQHVLEHDASVREVLDLAPDWEAERVAVGAPWTRAVAPPEHE